MLLFHIYDFIIHNFGFSLFSSFPNFDFAFCGHHPIFYNFVINKSSFILFYFISFSIAMMMVNANSSSDENNEEKKRKELKNIIEREEKEVEKFRESLLSSHSLSQTMCIILSQLQLNISEIEREISPLQHNIQQLRSANESMFLFFCALRSSNKKANYKLRIGRRSARNSANIENHKRNKRREHGSNRCTIL